MLTMETIEMRNAKCGSQSVNSECRNSCSQKCEANENRRLCSLMFAYVRLCSLNGKKNVASAARGHPGAVRNRPIADCRLEIANWGKAWRGQWGTGKTARF